MGARLFHHITASKTQPEAAKALGLTLKQVRRAEASALRKLRAGYQAHGITVEEYELLAYVLDDLAADLLLEGMPSE